MTGGALGAIGEREEPEGRVRPKGVGARPSE